NVVCDRALLGAYSTDRHRVTANLVRHAAEEVFGKRFTPRWLPWVGTAAAVVLLATTTGLLWKLRPWVAAHASTATHVASAANTGQQASAVPAPGAEIKRAGVSTPAPGAAQPTSLPPAADKAAANAKPAFTGHELTQLLAAHPAETDTDSAFSKLF